MWHVPLTLVLRYKNSVSYTITFLVSIFLCAPKYMCKEGSWRKEKTYTFFPTGSLSVMVLTISCKKMTLKSSSSLYFLRELLFLSNACSVALPGCSPVIWVSNPQTRLPGMVLFSHWQQSGQRLCHLIGNSPTTSQSQTRQTLLLSWSPFLSYLTVIIDISSLPFLLQ